MTANYYVLDVLQLLIILGSITSVYVRITNQITVLQTKLEFIMNDRRGPNAR
jgi:hypothetical protein